MLQLFVEYHVVIKFVICSIFRGVMCHFLLMTVVVCLVFWHSGKALERSLFD